jgi:transcriptional regulator of acetoin/glycerol metabolism
MTVPLRRGRKKKCCICSCRITFQGIPQRSTKAGWRRRGLKDLEQAAIAATLAETGGNKRKAAEKLGIGRATLWRKLRQGHDDVSK